MTTSNERSWSAASWVYAERASLHATCLQRILERRVSVEEARATIEETIGYTEAWTLAELAESASRYVFEEWVVEVSDAGEGWRVVLAEPDPEVRCEIRFDPSNPREGNLEWVATAGNLVHRMDVTIGWPGLRYLVVDWGTWMAVAGGAG